MADDAPIGRVEPVAPDAAPPADATANRRSPPVAPRPDAPSPFGIGDGLVHDQLEHPVRSPRGVEVRATVHDSAAHGNHIAEAIERARVADPTDRMQQLGGAAASAASGQSARLEPGRAGAGDGDQEDAVDPLGPVDPIAGEHHGDGSHDDGPPHEHRDDLDD